MDAATLCGEARAAVYEESIAAFNAAQEARSRERYAGAAKLLEAMYSSDHNSLGRCISRMPVEEVAYAIHLLDQLSKGARSHLRAAAEVGSELEFAA